MPARGALLLRGQTGVFCSGRGSLLRDRPWDCGNLAVDRDSRGVQGLELGKENTVKQLVKGSGRRKGRFRVSLVSQRIHFFFLTFQFF